ncbi:hypothetical protein THTE_0923 [Thermogutta terrifontis]|uniref:Uncharacterized protein n=1 Tax=Thermogutta terrifontis TaxID=1331910 RepID=A0A286RC49_9BACT|nr:hypothetical protein THTE_0923 [Thermogutta terrifontis]
MGAIQELPLQDLGLSRILTKCGDESVGFPVPDSYRDPHFYLTE